MALLCTCNIVAIGNLFFSLRTSKVLPVFLFLASGSAAVAVARAARARAARAQSMERTFSDESDENEEEKRQPFCPRSARTRWKGGRNGKGKKQRRQKMYIGGAAAFFSGNPRADSRITIIPLSGNAPRGNNWIPFAGSFA